MTDDHDARRKAEMERGAQISAAHAMPAAVRILSREFNPDHIEVETPEQEPPCGFETLEKFREREALSHLPNNRDGTPRK